jgi:hypothetical protein
MNYKAAKLAVGALLLVNFAWLVRTSANYVGFVDSGELAVACGTLGIAHPPGYPLYTLLGRLFCILHPGEIIQAVSFLSVVCGIGSAIFFFLTCRILFSSLHPGDRKTSLTLVAAAMSGMLLLYSPQVWILSVTNEVYALHLLFLSAITFLVTRARFTAGRSDIRTFALIAYIVGLSFCNHSSTIFVAAAIMLWVIADRSLRRQFSRLATTAAIMLPIAISSYLYLPIRASQSPLLNWGNPSTFENFIRHASGWQYRTWMFNKPFDEHISSMLDLIRMTVTEFPIALIIPALFGLIHLFKRDRILSACLLVILVLNIVFAAGYTIPEIDTYLLPMIFIYALFCAVGIATLVDLAFRKLPRLPKGKAPAVVAAIFLLVGIHLIVTGRMFTDRSRYDYVEKQTDMLLASMEPRAILLTSNWSFYSPLMYRQLVDRKRLDVTAIDFELLRRSWYYDYLEKIDPDLSRNIEFERKRLMPQLKLFERGLQYEQKEIEDAFQSLITAIMSTPGRPKYIDHGTQFRDLARFTRIPQGIVYRLIGPDESYIPRPPIEISLGEVSDELLERDYMLKQQMQIIELVNRKSVGFWEWYENQEDTTSGS